MITTELRTCAHWWVIDERKSFLVFNIQRHFISAFSHTLKFQRVDIHTLDIIYGLVSMMAGVKIWTDALTTQTILRSICKDERHANETLILDCVNILSL